MRLKYVIPAVLAVLVLAGLFFHDKWSPGDDGAGAQVAASSTLSSVPAHSRAVSPSSGAAAGGQRDEAPPPWISGPSTTTPSPRLAPTPQANREAAERAARMERAINRLQQLQSQKDVDPMKVDEVLGEVERANGSSVMQGVRLDVLRENLKLAAQMQKLATELQSLQERQVPPERKAEHQAAVDKKVAELEALQRGLRTDFYAGQPVPERK